MPAEIPALIERYTAALESAGVTSAFQSWSTFSPATEAEVSALSAEVGCALPDELTAWLGAVDHRLPFVGNYAANKAGRMVASIQGTRAIDFSRHLANITGWKDGRFDDGRLAPVYWQPQWVPLAQDGCGNEYCYDLAPGPAGRVGQIIAMEFQDGQGPYLAPWASLEAMLRDHLARLDRGAFTIDDEGFIEYS